MAKVIIADKTLIDEAISNLSSKYGTDEAQAILDDFVSQTNGSAKIKNITNNGTNIITIRVQFSGITFKMLNEADELLLK